MSWQVKDYSFSRHAMLPGGRTIPLTKVKTKPVPSRPPNTANDKVSPSPGADAGSDVAQASQPAVSPISNRRRARNPSA
ncbi:MAG: hypothetical protein HY674_22745 [Chloroflexi bacterium]|nr:hypothetical protein [Chloroflexota bacterium]